MKMNPYWKHVLDVPENGALNGLHFQMALEDLTCAEALETVVKFPSKSMTIEAQVAHHFAALWCDPRKATYRLAAPLAPSTPPTGKTMQERAEMEVARWFAALPEKYLPVPLSKVAHVRAEVRRDQIASISPTFLSRYETALHVTPRSAK
jgi:hypothetical protein